MGIEQAQALVGQWLPGGYRLRRLVGSGAFAWVFEATTAREQSVAVKVLQAASPEARTLFLREVKILRQLPPSDHCVRYVDDGVTEEGMPFLAMEFIDGCTLKDALKFKRIWDPDEACALMLQLCEALGGLHRLGLAHRDLKPENIMLTTSWQVKLMDFGLVKDAQGLLKLFESEDILTGRDFAENVDKAMLAGTPEYMAPEQFSDPMEEDESRAQTDTWTDVYSLGLIFYELLSGEKLYPFRPTSDDPSQYARELLAYIKLRTAARDADLERPPAIPVALWHVVQAALRQNPRQRPFNAASLSDGLRGYLGGAEVDDYDDEPLTSVADMRSLMDVLHGSPDTEGEGARAAPVDVAAVQAYREQRLNEGGTAFSILPPPERVAAHIAPNVTPPVDTPPIAPHPQVIASVPPPALASTSPDDPFHPLPRPGAVAGAVPAPRARRATSLGSIAVLFAAMAMIAAAAFVLLRGR